MAVGAGVSELLVEARCAAEPEPLREAGVWAEAVNAPRAKTAKMNKLFISKKLKIIGRVAKPYGVSTVTVGQKNTV